MIRYCTIADRGSGKTGSGWYAVACGDDNEEMIFEEDMEDRILSHLV